MKENNSQTLKASAFKGEMIVPHLLGRCCMTEKVQNLNCLSGISKHYAIL